MSSLHGPGRILDPICIPVEFLLSAFELASFPLYFQQRDPLFFLLLVQEEGSHRPNPLPSSIHIECITRDLYTILAGPQINIDYSLD
jgi:hypothetical protein